MMTQPIQLAGWAVLVSCLLLMPALPELANIVAIAGMVIGIPLLAIDLRSGKRLTAAEWIVVAASLILLAVLLPTIGSADDAVVLLALAPLPLSIPLAALLARLEDRLTLRTIATLALLGTAVAAGITGYDVFVRGIRRGGYLTMNPIHMADIAILLGLLSFAGILEGEWRKRLIFLAGPVFALLAVLWSGSRGPLLAYIGLAGFSVLFTTAIALPSRYRRPAVLSVFFLFVAVGIHGLSTSWLGQIRGVDQFLNLAGGNIADVDGSTRIRLQLYEGAWLAFLDSPIFGHGADFVAAADARVAGNISGWEHLHSDLADFAALGGTLGLIAYLAVLAAPLVAVLRRRPPHKALVYLGMTAGLGVLAMGLTNAIFGILTLTVLFSLVLALMFRMRVTA